MSGLQYAARGLVGLLTPQANTTVEPEFSLLLPPGHAHIAARMVSPAPGLDARLVAYIREAGQTASQFANAPLTSLAIACTGSSYLVGREEEQRLLVELSQQMHVPAFTSATAIVECLARLGARRLALASPYPESLTQASAAYWRSHGFTVVRIVRAETDPTQFHPIYALRTDAASGMLDALGSLDDVDAVLLLGTGLPSLAPLLQAHQARRGAPVLSSMLCLAWKAVEVAEPGACGLGDWLSGRHWAARLALA